MKIGCTRISIRKKNLDIQVIAFKEAERECIYKKVKKSSVVEFCKRLGVLQNTLYKHLRHRNVLISYYETNTV